MLVSTLEQLERWLDTIDPPSSDTTPTLYIDLEGHNLSKDGTLSLFTVLSSTSSQVYLVDVQTLRRSAFTHSNANGNSLKDVLQSPTFAKVIFDVRRDAEALYHLYSVRVQGALDLQLVELAQRPSYKRKHLVGLASCIKYDLQVSPMERNKKERIKNAGIQLFDPTRGGSYAVFDQRPLAAELEAYCEQDVTVMPRLLDTYKGRMNHGWLGVVKAETEKRVIRACGTGYTSGQHMAFAPAMFGKSLSAALEETAASID